MLRRYIARIDYRSSRSIDSALSGRPVSYTRVQHTYYLVGADRTGALVVRRQTCTFSTRRAGIVPHVSVATRRRARHNRTRLYMMQFPRGLTCGSPSQSVTRTHACALSVIGLSDRSPGGVWLVSPVGEKRIPLKACFVLVEHVVNGVFSIRFDEQVTNNDTAHRD